MQNLGFHSGTPESESAFKQNPQVIHMYIEFEKH